MMATHFYGCVFNFSFLALLFVQQDNKLFKTKLVCFSLFIKTHPKEKRVGAIVYFLCLEIVANCGLTQQSSRSSYHLLDPIFGKLGSPLWMEVKKCLGRSPLAWNFCAHRGHWNGHSLLGLCERRCFFMACLVLSFLGHSGHWLVRLVLWFRFMWALRAALLL